ncbi:MAG: hypothetical protein ACHQUB_00995 [Candidatus Saccharimonadia bacterium]
MSEKDVFIQSELSFCKVVAQIQPSQWNLQIPEWFEVGRTQSRNDLTLKTIINYHAFDTAWIPDVFAGKTIQEVGDQYAGDLIGDDPIAAYKKLSSRAIESLNANYKPDRIIHFSYGDFLAKIGITHPTSFRIFRAYDVAKLIGVDRKLPDDMLESFYSEVLPEVDFWRKMGIFKAAQEFPEDADTQARIFALTGRDPNWRA